MRVAHQTLIFPKWKKDKKPYRKSNILNDYILICIVCVQVRNRYTCWGTWCACHPHMLSLDFVFKQIFVAQKLEIKILWQCFGSVTFWYGSRCRSRSSNPYFCLTDSDADLGGPKSYGSVSGTMVKSQKEVKKQ